MKNLHRYPSRWVGARILPEDRMRLVIRILVNAVALWAATLVPGISNQGGLGTLLLVALVFGFVNALIRPLLSLLSCPLIILTLGLFTLILNAFMLQITAWLGGKFGLDFRVDTFMAAFLGAVVVSVVSTVLSWLLPDRRS
jgi:putative membrane protein